MIALLPGERTLRRLERLRFETRAAPAAAPAGARRARRPGGGREFLGFRPYEIGDDLRDLDWAATLRRSRAHVRVYRQEAESSLLLLIDGSASMAFGEPAKLAYAQALAGALGYLAVAHPDRVGALAFGDGVQARLPAGRGSAQWRALRDLVGALSAAGSTSFADMPAELARLCGLRGLAVILSDFYPVEAFATGLRRLARSDLSVVALHLLSPQELDPGVDGEVELVDLETGETRSGFVGVAERAAYARALAHLRRDLAGLCRESGIRYVQASTAVPIARCLQETLVRAGVLRREGA
jgi:uncharacterized protein (DUF58 family)